MATKHLKKVFLSASIPLPERNPAYFESADILAIRDSVRAIASLILPEAILVWGGHPSITPMIRVVLERLNKSVAQHVSLYQSRFFEAEYPEDNQAFGSIIYTNAVLNDRDASLRMMRDQLFSENQFAAGVFIGGMEGIEIEFNMFREHNPGAPVFPVASTGAASRILFEKNSRLYDQRLLTDYTYLSLFDELLKPLL